MLRARPHQLACVCWLALAGCGRTGASVPDCAGSGCSGEATAAAGSSGEAGEPGEQAQAGSGQGGLGQGGTTAGAGGVTPADAGAGSAEAGASACDSDTGQCLPIAWSCLSRELGHSACYIDTIYTCGPDFVHESAVQCVGTCSYGDSPACIPPRCGDWKVEEGEHCDDGNTSDDDACTATCQIGRCGDGLPASVSGFPDACDDGNQANTDACTNACQPARCGDGALWEGHEYRDTGYVSPLDSCGVSCRDPYQPATSVVALDALGHHSCALLDNGSIKCWGWDEGGQLGICSLDNVGDAPGEVEPAMPQADLGGKRAVRVATGNEHSCAILEGGSVKCWGYNYRGQLGLGHIFNRSFPGELGDALLAVDLGSGHTALELAAGYETTCALLDDHGLKCWGANGQGQLGLGNKRGRGDGPGELGDALPEIDLGTGRHVQAMDASLGNFVCAVLDNATLKCWGRNDEGQLGLGDANDRGDEAGEMGDALGVVDLGAGRTLLSVATGMTHACALLDNGHIKCWGTSLTGALGLGAVTSRGSLPNEMGDQLPEVDLGSGRSAVSVVAGADVTCALLDNASVKCWGDNDGTLGLGDKDPHGDAPNEMGDQLPAVNLGTGQHAKSLRAGYGFVCALLESGRVKCWGHNSIGQLGRNDPTQTPDPIGDEPGEMGDALPFVQLF